MDVQYDEDLAKQYVIQIKEGNGKVFSQLYDLTCVMVYRTVSLLLKNKDDVPDVVQDIYVQLFSHLRKFDDQRAFKNWLLGIVYRQVASYRRKQWLSFRLHDKVSLEVLTSHDSQAPIDISNREQLELWLNALSFKQRQIIVLKYYHDLSQEEIAQILNIPVGTVKSRIGSGLRSLRQQHVQTYSFESIRSVK